MEVTKLMDLEIDTYRQAEFRAVGQEFEAFVLMLYVMRTKSTPSNGVIECYNAFISLTTFHG